MVNDDDDSKKKSIPQTKSLREHHKFIVFCLN